LVVDIATTVNLEQWDGVHQVCDPSRAATYMRIGDTRYRWEFQLLPGETTDDFGTLAALRPLIAAWVGDIPPADLKLVRVTEYTFAPSSPTGGAGETSSCSATQPISPRR
jgi:3-(3-hydroxy-phenyl)propionate hydroxylase